MDSFMKSPKRRLFPYLRVGSVPRLGLGSCDRRHKLGFENPIIFWTSTYCAIGDCDWPHRRCEDRRHPGAGDVAQ